MGVGEVVFCDVGKTSQLAVNIRWMGRDKTKSHGKTGRRAVYGMEGVQRFRLPRHPGYFVPMQTGVAVGKRKDVGEYRLPQ